MVLQVRWCTQSWSMSRLNVTEYTSTFFLSNSLTSSSPFLFLVCYLIYTYIIIVVYCASTVLQTPQKPFNGCIPAVDKIYRKYSFNECIYNMYICTHSTFKPWIEDIWIVISYCNFNTIFLCDIVLQHFWYDPKLKSVRFDVDEHKM